MTVTRLTNAFDLCNEIETGGGAPLLYVYERGTGQTLFAVFQTLDEVDLDRAPEVVTFAAINRPAGGWPVVGGFGG